MKTRKSLNPLSPAKPACRFLPAKSAIPFATPFATTFAALIAAHLLAPCAFAAPTTAATASALPKAIASGTAAQAPGRDGKAGLPPARSSTQRWAPGLVTPLTAGAGLVTTIELDPGEKILSYASGFSSAWEFAAEGSRLYLKPKRPRSSTNLAVATASRTYLFELRSAPARNASESLPVDYLVRVTVPPPPAPPGARALSPEMKREAAARLLAKPLVPGGETPGASARYRMNFGEAPESQAIAPVAAGDDGRFTYLRLPAGCDFPAVFRKGAEGEAIVASHLEPDGRLVIHGVYPELRLRAGAAVVGLYREPEAENLPPLPGKAATPELKRELIHESEEHLKE